MTDLKKQLKPIFDHVGYENIWRPIYDKNERLIARGSGKFADIIPETLASVCFEGKTVVDLGCNFGCYTFLAARLGARRVVGIDINSEIIRGCELLKAHYGFSNVEFHTADFTKGDLGETFDMGMMIDFIGRGMVRKGKVRRCLAGLERLSRSEMLVTLHPEYNIEDDLHMDLDKFASMYPSAFIQDKQFNLLDFVQATFSGRWAMQIECNERSRTYNLKSPVHFIRK